jgi:hypothetical protein
VEAYQREPRLVLFVDRLDFDLGGVRQKRANDQTRTAANGFMPSNECGD